MSYHTPTDAETSHTHTHPDISTQTQTMKHISSRPQTLSDIAHPQTPRQTTHQQTPRHLNTHTDERWGAGVETQKNVRGEIGGWGRVPFNETYAPSLSTIYDGA